MLNEPCRQQTAVTIAPLIRNIMCGTKMLLWIVGTTVELLWICPPTAGVYPREGGRDGRDPVFGAGSLLCLQRDRS